MAATVLQYKHRNLSKEKRWMIKAETARRLAQEKLSHADDVPALKLWSCPEDKHTFEAEPNRPGLSRCVYCGEWRVQWFGTVLHLPFQNR